MNTAEQRGWGDPDSPGYRANHIVLIHAGGVNLYVRREVAPLFQHFCDDIVARGYRLNVNADDWGYNNRDIRGRPGVKSNHAWGLAVDLNSSTNPMTEDGHVHTDMPAWVPETAAKYGLFWGGHYSGSRKDPMHFEFLGTPDDVSRYLPHDPQPAPQEDDDTMYTIYENEENGLWFGVSGGFRYMLDPNTPEGKVTLAELRNKNPDGSARSREGGNVSTRFLVQTTQPGNAIS